MKTRTREALERPPLARRRPSALYVHVPFCVRLCPYCDFAVTEKEPGLERDYVAALARELASLPRFAPRTIFVGGGTPTELSQSALERFAEALRASCDLSRVREFTFEANPGTLAPKKLSLLRGLGVNRVSLGAQSFDAKTLATLGRGHAPADTARAVRELRAAGIARVNVDIIFGVPGQTEQDVARDVEALVAIAPDHVSTYGLTFEKGTPFDIARREGRLAPVKDERAARLFSIIRRMLRSAGFRHYEISNFARPGSACAHNRVYWRNGAYHGVGCSAASHVGGVRRVNLRDPRAYVAAVLEGRDAVAEREELGLDAKVKETAFLALRTARGVRRETFLRDLGVDPLERFRDAFAKLAGLGLVALDERGARLTGRGVAVADAVARELF